MVKFDFSQLEKLPAKQRVSSADWRKYDGLFMDYQQKFFSRGQGFLDILDNTSNLALIRKFSAKVSGMFDDVVVLGIGGSALGARCFGQALGPLFENKLSSGPRLTVLDNIDPVLLAEFERCIDWRRTLFLVITKSGTTTETLAQFLYFKAKVTVKKLDWKKHFVLVTDPLYGPLRQLVECAPGVEAFDVPQNVGGRFSALSAVGLLPAALAGFDIEKIIAGAKKGRNQSLCVTSDQNPAWRLALTQYLLYKKGKSITVFWPYSQKLRALSDWYGQLLAESIGKKLDRKGRRVSVGITPVSAMGVSDQHSQNQLYNDGPDDKLYLFLNVLKPDADMKIPCDPVWNPREIAYVQNRSFNQLFRKEMEGTVGALVKQGRPLIRISLDSLNAEHLGQLMLILQMSVAYLGELFGIDAYNQPGVELSKKLTREMLK